MRPIRDNLYDAKEVWSRLGGANYYRWRAEQEVQTIEHNGKPTDVLDPVALCRAVFRSRSKHAAAVQQELAAILTSTPTETKTPPRHPLIAQALDKLETLDESTLEEAPIVPLRAVVRDLRASLPETLNAQCELVWASVNQAFDGIDPEFEFLDALNAIYTREP